ncbi:MAG: GntR family transcriptional regulator [Pirellulaceae bacterium]|nr:GntR family transcriptional regulator [Pirellulaceae bacterium]
MFFEIDVSNGVPVYEQVARQIKFAVAAGSLVPGEMIPSVREMARELAINPNTVARAYRELQNEQIIETVRGEGLAVADRARGICRESRQQIIRDRLQGVLEEAFRSQLSADEITRLVNQEIKRLQSKYK